MRIGLFTDTYPPFINGVSTSVYMLKRALEEKGHQVFVVTVNPENMKYEIDEKDKVIRIPGIPFGIYDYRLTGIYPVKAMNTIKKWKLDVIHSHTEFGIGTFARIIAKQFNVPLVHTYHTMYEDYIHYVTKGYFDKSSKKIVEYLTLFYCDKTASELIVPTNKTYKLFKDKYKVDRNIHIVPTGIEVERFFTENVNKKDVVSLKKKYKLNADDFVLLFVGRLAEEKNIVYLIDTVRDIIKKNKDASNIKFLIIGDGPDYEAYKELVDKYNMSEHIILTGRVPWEDVPKYYQLADLFLTASKSETQGLTVVEAMAAGVPPIAIDDESFRNVIVDDLNGKIFRTKKELRTIVMDLKSNREKLDMMKRQARVSSEMYSSKFFAESILHVYNFALKNKKSKYPAIQRLVDKVKKDKE